MTQTHSIESLAERAPHVPVATLERLALRVPAACGTEPSPATSPDHYRFVDTLRLLDTAYASGYQIERAFQRGGSQHATHWLTLRRADAQVTRPELGGLRPTVTLRNSHTGQRSAQLLAGLFRLVCSNGLAVPIPGHGWATRYLHHGKPADWLYQQWQVMADASAAAIDRAAAWSQIQVPAEAAVQLAAEVAAVRFPNEPDISAVRYPQWLLRARRQADGGTDLFTRINVVQEHAVANLRDGDRLERVNREIWEIGQRWAVVLGGAQ
jgi:hypothetical protein